MRRTTGESTISRWLRRSWVLAQRFRDMTVENPNQISSTEKDEIIQTLIDRVDSGGMVVVDSDLYLVEPMGTEFADIVLPAAAWGEHDAARCNGERRLRLYSKFYDAPGKAQIEVIGESPYKFAFDQMSFKPRTVGG